MTLEHLICFARQQLADSPLRCTATIALVGILLHIIGNEIVRARARVPGMKGPRGWPVIGNLWDIRTNAAARFYDWSKTYGDVYQIQMGNTPVVVVNSAVAAKKLFVANSQAISSRPITYTFHKIASTTAGLTIGTSPYDDSLKRRKKGAAAALNKPAIQSYVPHMDLESKDFIKDLLFYGKAGTVAIDPLPMIQRLSLSLAMTINWGVRVACIEDPMFIEIVRVEEELNSFRSTTGNLQDYIPLLRMNPVNRNSAKAREMRQRRDAYLHTLNSGVIEKVNKGTDTPCIQANVIKNEEAKLNDVELTSISLSMLSGGFETVATTVQWSVAYFAIHPEIQDKAFNAIQEFQEPLKAETSGLPDVADDQKCVYIAAMAREALRYFTVIPLALPRASIRDVVYEGVRIPEGTTYYLNAWACNYDKNLWTDPEVFRPERWLEKPDAPMFTLGIGYRMCSGHLLAHREVYLVFMRMLSSFRFKAVGEIKCNPSRDFKNPADLIMAPEPYRVLCVPRNETRLRRALDEWNPQG
ncbi:cytochrome P450 [Pseudomassariella vexata]|uniref:Cytochrome P450 n=1 Tax=Pseudomassariella vexata TaxID=1141098 RepID=A0A1Y2DM85_9PEZI|nr:cytochrome P450 [Pseudomassariella vexata]ORY60264.1 cytochrome P450 [Pseudomassariella vexata]